jgi:hypothetical protein
MDSSRGNTIHAHWSDNMVLCLCFRRWLCCAFRQPESCTITCRPRIQVRSHKHEEQVTSCRLDQNPVNFWRQRLWIGDVNPHINTWMDVALRTLAIEIQCHLH